mmetsp:Transcript_67844/g.201912  ORF Transcript_67844/g.201912 Transcript_67844/m.201912 type:complete len:324 (-) Transcript_67844:186-1157(-)
MGTSAALPDPAVGPAAMSPGAACRSAGGVAGAIALGGSGIGRSSCRLSEGGLSSRGACGGVGSGGTISAACGTSTLPAELRASAPTLGGGASSGPPTSSAGGRIALGAAGGVSGRSDMSSAASRPCTPPGPRPPGGRQVPWKNSAWKWQSVSCSLFVRRCSSESWRAFFRFSRREASCSARSEHNCCRRRCSLLSSSSITSVEWLAISSSVTLTGRSITRRSIHRWIRSSFCSSSTKASACRSSSSCCSGSCSASQAQRLAHSASSASTRACRSRVCIMTSKCRASQSALNPGSRCLHSENADRTIASSARSRRFLASCFAFC